MIPAIFPQRLALAGLLFSLPLFGGFREDIGFSGLQNEFDTVPDGSSLRIAHIEYVRDGVWAPQAAGELTGKSISYSPSVPATFSYHGDEVGRVFYGSMSSIIPGAKQIRAFEAWAYYDNSLNTSQNNAPAVADWDVENHSYIANAGMSNSEGGRRLDFRIDRDGNTATVVLENGTGTIPPLFGNTYNTIVVGSSTGNHSRGGTTRDVTGRLKPDIVGTANWTSYAGPIVGSAAGLLIAKAKADTSLASAKRPEVVKALLMAGATKDEFPTWSRSSTAPMDPVYGAGEVNIQNSYGMLVAGRQTASSSAIRASRGWDLNSTAAGSKLRYFFTVGAGQSGTVSAVLTWHRNVAPINGAWNQGTTTSLDNLDLRLYRATAQFQTTDLLQTSISTIDNVEHIFLRNLTEGTYALEVTAVSGSRQFGIAWMVAGVSGDPQPPPAPVAPAITKQPAALTVTQGASASFSVEVSGTSPFTYQWRKDGAAIVGATSSSYSISSVGSANAGTYTVSVANSAGTALSNGAFLTVNPATVAPSITSQPVSVTATQGTSVSFSVAVSGTSPFTYQWKKDGAAIVGATSSSYSISSVGSANAGTYTVSVANSAGTAISNGAFLTVNPATVAPSITSQPVSVTATQGASVSFSVGVSGTSPFTYQWKKDGAAIVGANSSSYSISSVGSANAGTYTVSVANSAGTALSNGASLTVSQAAIAPSIKSQPVSVTATAGGSASFSVSVEGTAPFTYQWRKSGVAITGATSSTYSISSVSSSNAGTYTVSVSNSAGTALSNGASLTVSPAAIAPSITSQPVSVTTTQGASVSFSVAVSGTSPFTYQWKKDGAAIVGASSSSYSISSVGSANAGTYTVSVANSVGTALSNGASLTVSPAAIAPTITRQPVEQTVTQGSAVSLSVEVSGTGPFSFQWFKYGNGISGANSSVLSIGAASLSDSGNYTVSVSNSAGTVLSKGAFLTVNTSATAPAIVSQPSSLTVNEGGTANFSVGVQGTAPFTYQWRKNGVTIPGVTAASLSLGSVTSSNAATYTVLVSNSVGSVASAGATLTVQSAQPGAVNARLGNISSRAKVEIGSGILISGFVVSGNQPKTLLVRAVGPTLSSFNLSGLLARPMIRIYSGENLVEEIPAGGRVPSVQAARDAAVLAGAFSLPDNSLDSVIVRAFAPGGYTVHVYGADGGTGIAIVEVYDLDASSSGSRVVNLSTRSKVGRDNSILIPGVSVSGTSPRKVLIRAVGPGLRQYKVDGVLERPKIALYQGSTLLTENTGWTTAPNAAEMPGVASRVGAFALSESSADSALLVTLAPGGYTLHISGADGGTGVVLAEVFEVQ